MARKYIKRPRPNTEALPLASNGTAVYLRVSTELQAEEGFSLEAQRDRLLAHCAGQGWSVDERHIYVDAGISGKSAADRPAYLAMLAAARAGEVRRIVATKLDRLARNVSDFLALVDECERCGCSLVLLDLNIDTGTPTGKLVATTLAAIAEWERKLIAERTMSGRKQKARGGGYNGSRVPLGYAYDGRQWTITEDAETVRRIFREYVGGRTMLDIAGRLEADGAATATGGRWSQQAVRYILTNGIYAGLAQWDGQEQPDARPAVITPALYEQAQTLLLAARPGRPRG